MSDSSTTAIVRVAAIVAAVTVVIAYMGYRTPGDSKPLTQEEYLQQLLKRKASLITSWFRNGTEIELEYLKKEIERTEAKIKVIPAAKCTQCLLNKAPPQGYDICEDCMRPVIASFYSRLSNE
jgi:hypothetical protein